MSKNMKTSILITILLTINLFSVSGQNFKSYRFKCWNEKNSILLPPNFFGPNYFNYEEGSIISFITQDSCIVEILCGANADLVVDDKYVKTDSIMKNYSVNQFFYEIKGINLYARKIYSKRFIILYQHASYTQKKELDIVFNLIEEENH